MRRSGWFRLLGLVVLAGCSSITFSSQRLDNLQRELNRRYGLWKQEAIPSYDYRFERTCPCDSSLLRPVIVSVVDSAIVAVTYADSGTALPDSSFRYYLTIDGLFQQIQLAINIASDSLVVEYDPVLNYPTKIVVNQDLRQSGDELSLFASELKPKQP